MDFDIRPIAKNCAVSGEMLVPGAECWSVVTEVDGKLVRQDISAERWSGPPEGAVGFWKCTVPQSAGVQKKMDVDSLFEYFLQLTDSPNLTEQDYLFVVALLLMRKRRLILEENIEIDDQPAMRLIGSGGEGPFEVPERELSDERVAQLQARLLGETQETSAA